jgi:hypothetical protein
VGPKGAQLSEAALRKLADAMTAGGGGNTGIPAGYTYLGQFVDHDLTMDRTEVMFGASIAPADMKQGRSPALDLDSLYGAGPNDPGSEKFYASDGLRLKMGKTDGPDIIISAFNSTAGRVELMAWDHRAGGFNFYRTVDRSTAWAFAGNSRHALYTFEDDIAKPAIRRSRKAERSAGGGSTSASRR